MIGVTTDPQSDCIGDAAGMDDTVGIHHCYSRHTIYLLIEFTFQPSSIVTPRVLHNVYLSECPNESSAMSGSGHTLLTLLRNE